VTLRRGPPVPENPAVHATRSRGSTATLAMVLFITLFVVVLVAMALVVRAKTPDLMLEVTDLPKRFTPNGDGRNDVASITFFIRADEPSATVAIVGRDLAPIKTLDSDVQLQKDQEVTYRWNGTTNRGSRAPLGRYRLSVVLPNVDDRHIVFPRRIDIVG
jgi:hypothetical protein